ncbi:ABC transporter ATP-binding protein [Vallitalea sp.]|jgi:simple sugar transport system ATP-binding protein|uniref:ABC transporter ATP-binding protein n=1 Tax=Vallitalea sp. TaxID=1882829 RepID=UPI0025E681EB|nr:ABC transporter ATP-binding protein [Vallitalea sp.]MCT4686136.1 ABC transporter ATP-binding protein [Vallitalea sp.]
MVDAVRMLNIEKIYTSVNVKAVDKVDFTLQKGEIHSLLGENGAGKSTLMKILYGMNYPYEGEVYINGTKQIMKHPMDAIKQGISMVHQHFMLTPVMTVTENVVIGREPNKGLFFDKARAETEIQEMIDTYGFNMSASAKVESLSTGEQQRVEILKAMYGGADIIILDEPTAVLTPQEVDELFKIMSKLKKDGKTIVIITHKLKETINIADRASVLRDGKMIEKNIDVSKVTVEDLSKMMVGRDVELGMQRPSTSVGETAFEVKNLSLEKNGRNILNNINLQLRRGEILGIAGIEGNGQSELLEILTGVKKATTVEMYKDGAKIDGNARNMISNKVGHVPEDRMSQGLVTEMSLMDNVILGYHKNPEFSKKGILKKDAIHEFATDKIDSYRIKASNAKVACKTLSGGNQQKIVIARIFSQDPDVIIIAQPTRGVDIGAMEYIHSKMLELRDEGKAILLISADLDEVRNLSDRLAVIYEGEIVLEAKRDEFTESELGVYMTGSHTIKGGVGVE